MKTKAGKDLYVELIDFHAHERGDHWEGMAKKEFEKLVKRQRKKRNCHFRELKEHHEEFESLSLSTPEQRSSSTEFVNQLKAERPIKWDKLEWKDQKGVIERQEEERGAQYQKFLSQVD